MIVSDQESNKISLKVTYSHSSDKQDSTIEDQCEDKHIDGKNSMTAQSTSKDQNSVTNWSVGNSYSDKKVRMKQ